MKIRKILFTIPLATTILFSQPTGEEVFKKNCSICHANILGVVDNGKYDDSYITIAPYVYELVPKLKEKIKTKEKFSEFITEYIENPDKRKSLYGKEAIEKFELMPSLKGAISKEEVLLLSNYLYNEKYKIKETPKIVKEEPVKIDPRESLFRKNCANCHITTLSLKVNPKGEQEIIYEAPYIGDVIVKTEQETKTKEEFIAYIGSYINDPDVRKSLYSKEAIKKFESVMPSLKGAMSDDETLQLTNYLYETYGESNKSSNESN